jgi:nicotinamidase-related amidase
MTMEFMNWAIEMFRAKNLPVIRILNEDPGMNIMPGQPGFDLHPKIAVLPTDPVFNKRYGNALRDTGLDQYLKDNGIDTLFLTGISAEYCVMATYHGAINLDYRPIMVKDCVDSLVDNRVPFVLDISETISLGALKIMLDMC